MGLATGNVLDRYVVEGLLGRGAMGRVYRATDKRLRRAVAIKILEPAAAAGEAETMAALREARAAAAIVHPNVTAVFDADHCGGTSFIVMELVPGTALRQLVGDGSVPLGTRVRWLVEIAAALAAAHQVGVVHRDIKPENVIVRDDGLVKVLDFGVARFAAASTPALGIPGLSATAPGQTGLAGTPAYMAPEQIQGSAVDTRADQFAWGVVAYELLSGALPWKITEGVFGTLASIMADQPKPLPESVPAEVADVVMRALAKSRNARFPTMIAAATALSPFATGPLPLLGLAPGRVYSEPAEQAPADRAASNPTEQASADRTASNPTEPISADRAASNPTERTLPDSLRNSRALQPSSLGRASSEPAERTSTDRISPSPAERTSTIRVSSDARERTSTDRVSPNPMERTSIDERVSENPTERTSNDRASSHLTERTSSFRLRGEPSSPSSSNAISFDPPPPPSKHVAPLAYSIPPPTLDLTRRLRSGLAAIAPGNGAQDVTPLPSLPSLRTLVTAMDPNAPPVLHDPDFFAPIDLDAHLALLPSGASCKGVFFIDAVRLATKTRSTAELHELAGAPDRRYIAFRDYPMADNLRITVTAARCAYPGIPLGQALRRLGQTAFDMVMGSHVGKTLFGVLDGDVERLLLQWPKAYELFYGFGHVTVETSGPGLFTMRAQRFPVLLETYQVGVLEGALRRCRAHGRVRVSLTSLADATFEIDLV